MTWRKDGRTILTLSDISRAPSIPTRILYENGAPRWFLIPDADLKAAIGSMGITADTTVVVYSDSRIFAARLWWILKYAGVTDVRFMNGGSQQWLANGYETETTINYPVPAIFSGTTHPEYLATTDYVFSQYTNTDTTLIADVRSKDEYDGLISGYSYVNAKGRIPNSVWASDGDDGSSVYNDERRDTAQLHGSQRLLEEYRYNLYRCIKSV